MSDALVMQFASAMIAVNEGLPNFVKDTLARSQ